MSSGLDIHPASGSERLAAYRNVYDVWGGGLPLEEHLRRRLESVQHNRARWYVGCLDGRVVTALGCYPLAFRLRGRGGGDGRVVPGIAIGSVHTLAGFRGRGFAAQLIQCVEQAEHEAGAQLSLLYSDIDPAYYERLGYVVCPSHAGWASADASGPAARSEAQRSEPDLERLDAAAAHAWMSDVYGRGHARLAISIERDEGYWSYLLRKAADDGWYRYSDEARNVHGYLWLGTRDSSLVLRDCALSDDSDAAWNDLWRAALRLAAGRHVASIGGWLPDTAATRTWFAIQPRETEITMLKPLADAVPLDVELTAAAGWFHEIDHV